MTLQWFKNDCNYLEVSEKIGSLGYRPNRRVRLPQTIFSLFKQIGSIETLSRCSRTPPKRKTLTKRNTTVRLGKEKDVEQELRKYAEPPGSGKSYVI